MTKIELLTEIVKKQDELINWFDSDLESGDALIRLQLSILKKQLEECKESETHVIDEMDESPYKIIFNGRTYIRK